VFREEESNLTSCFGYHCKRRERDLLDYELPMEVPEKPLGGKELGTLGRSNRWRRLEADESSIDSI
jgi:hypothetical protein